MMVPSRMRESLVYQGVADMYDWEMRSTAKVVKPIETAEGVRSVLKDWRTFKTGQPLVGLRSIYTHSRNPPGYGRFMDDITDGYGTYLAWDDTLKHRRDRLLVSHHELCCRTSLNTFTDPRRTIHSYSD